MTGRIDHKASGQSKGSLVIRADATKETGIGHVMRCMTLASGWSRRGGMSALVGRVDSEKLAKRLKMDGVLLFRIERSHPAPEDLQMTLRVLADMSQTARPDAMLVADGYHLDPDFQASVRRAGYGGMVIDDNGHLPAYHADLLLNQNMDADAIPYTCDQDTKCLLGSRHVLLRDEFRQRVAGKKRTPKAARNLLVTLGGSDSRNGTLTVLQSLELLDIDRLEAVAVLGPANRNIEEVTAWADKAPYPLRTIVAPENMSEWMAWADLAVSAGGTTCWELAFMGVPNLVVVLANNQEAQADALDRWGCSRNLGPLEKLRPERLAGEVRELALDPGRRKAMSEAGQRLIDGRGVDRVLDEVEALINERRRQGHESAHHRRSPR